MVSRRRRGVHVYVGEAGVDVFVVVRRWGAGTELAGGGANV